MRAVAFAIATCLLLTACGSKDPEPRTAWEQDAAAKDKAAKASELRQIMEEDKGKAAEAGQKQLDRAEADRKDIEEAGG